MTCCPQLLDVIRVLLAAIEWTRGCIRQVGAQLELDGQGPVDYQILGDMLCSEYVATKLLGASHSWGGVL